MAWMIRVDEISTGGMYFLNSAIDNGKNYFITGSSDKERKSLIFYSFLSKSQKYPHSTFTLITLSKFQKDFYVDILNELGSNGNKLNVITQYEFMNLKSHYDFIFCDNIEDFSIEVVKRIVKSSKQAIVSGNFNSKIYSKDWSGKEIIDQSTMNNLGFVEYTIDNYYKIPKTSNRFCIYSALSEKDEVEFIKESVIQSFNFSNSTAILFSTNKSILQFINFILDDKCKKKINIFDFNDSKQIKKINNQLEDLELRFKWVNTYEDLKVGRSNKQAIVMTYHKSKGLNFDNIYLPFLNSNLFIGYDYPENLFSNTLSVSNYKTIVTYSGEVNPIIDRVNRNFDVLDIHQ